MRSLIEGLRAGLPIAAGYLPSAIAFGIVATEAGLNSLWATGVSAVIFAGASQFALAGLLAAGASVPVTAAALLFINLRHALYGPSLAPRLRGLGRKRAATISFGLTDEVFALASRGPTDGQRFSFLWIAGLELTAYASWVGGTWIGAYGGSAVAQTAPSLSAALGFALPALFIALLISLLKGAGRGALVAAAVAAAVATGFHLAEMSNTGILAAAVLGPATALAAGRLRG